MSSSTSSSEHARRGGAAELGVTLAAALVALLAIALVERAYREARGFPTIWPGWTRTEFQWRVSRADAPRSVFVVGDSRVGWTFSEVAFDEQMAAEGRPWVHGVNASMPASQAALLVWHVIHRVPPEEAGLIVVNYSPASFGDFEQEPGALIGDLKLQDLIDDRLATGISERVYTYGMGLEAVAERIRGDAGRTGGVVLVSRTVHGDGTVGVELADRNGGQVDPVAYQLESYETVYRRMVERPGRGELQLALMEKAVDEARARGWELLLVRFPVGERMRALEAELGPTWEAAAVAERLGLDLVDYQDDPRTAELETLDESHLTREAGRQMARILARDLLERFPGRFAPPDIR